MMRSSVLLPLPDGPQQADRLAGCQGEGNPAQQRPAFVGFGDERVLRACYLCSRYFIFTTK